MADLSKSVAIVGVAESDEIGKVPGKSSLQHHAEAAYNALEDAGLSIKDVDGILSAGFSTLVVLASVTNAVALMRLVQARRLLGGTAAKEHVS